MSVIGDEYGVKVIYKELVDESIFLKNKKKSMLP